ncbi:hypothetical protein ABQD64_13725 [Vagococcus fluvialis]|uniref:hypothetical protein n=1 Tax=Vagococcus fluvialis TaxID=2738 RepID=UPI0032E50334
MDIIDVTGSLEPIVTGFVNMVKGAGPILLPAILAVLGINLGFKWIKKLGSKVG